MIILVLNGFKKPSACWECVSAKVLITDSVSLENVWGAAATDVTLLRLYRRFCFMSCERSMTHKGALFFVAGACTLLMHDWPPTRPVIGASAPISSAQQTDGICLSHIEEYILEYIFCTDF